GQAVEVFADGAEVVDGLGLRDDVELASLVEQQRHVHRGLEPGTEAALRLAHTFGDGAHLAAALGDERDDPIGLAEPDRAQHDALVAVEAHAATRRSRRSDGRAVGTRAPPRTDAHAGSRARARR